MKGILRILGLWGTFVFIVPSFAAEPGGTRTWYAYFDVTDQAGVGLSGISVELIVTTWYGDQIDPAYYTCYKTGTTTSGGYAYLACVIPGEFAEGLVEMRAYMREPDYTIISSQNTYTYTNGTIWPEFVITLDVDGNGIYDNWEMPLAQKFCPTLKLHHATEWIAPEPVEYLGVSKQDLWFQLYNLLGQVVGDYPIQDEALFNPPISDFWQPWMSSPNPNYSTLTGNAYDYTGKPPSGAYGQYKLRFHYNYAGGVNTPSGWISYYQTERNQNLFPHTTYAHLFLYNNKPVIQYWLYYPYNDGYNNHEGDWEHINVRVSEANPSTATIETIDFYFHHKVKILTSGYQVVDGTHPKVYVGGSCAGHSLGCESGNTTGGSFPWTGTWYDIGPLGYDEYVHGLGLTISYSSLQIVLLPERNKINYNLHPEMCWFNVTIRFGIIEASSPWDFIEPFTYAIPWVEDDVGNNAVPGPALNAGWNKVGTANGKFDSY